MAKAIPKKNLKECTMCREEKHNTKDFYKSYSNIYKGNDGRVIICKDCVMSLYEKYLQRFLDEKRALYRLCELLDVYFSEKLYESVEQQAVKQDVSIAKLYLQRVNSLVQYKDLTSDDSDSFAVLTDDKEIEIDTENEEIDLDKINIEELYNFTITKDILTRWGKGLTKEEYFDLESKYLELINVYESKTPVQRWLYQQISKTQIEAEKCRRSGNMSGYEKMMNTLSKLLADSNIKPVQENSVGDDNINNWGMRVKLIEDTRPIGEASPEFKDVDGIYKYITTWFIKPFARVFGLINSNEEVAPKLQNVLDTDVKVTSIEDNKTEEL